MKRIFTILTMVALLLTGCEKDPMPGQEPEPIAVTSVSLDKTEVALIVGESANVKAIVKPDDAANKEVKWTVANTSIATVDEGEVTAVAVGETTLIVTTVDGGHTATIPVKVTAKAVKVSQIRLVGMPTEFTAGRSVTISAVITPDDATDKSVTFTSSNPEVATVEYTKSEYNYSLALLKAVGPGKATITATANDGSGVKAEAEVDVLPAPKMVSDISITMSKSEVKVGYMVRATATVSPEDAENREVTWSSSNTAIARVRVVAGNNNAADVIGVSPGTVIITATAKDGSGVTASVPVTVIDDGESTYQSITITTSKAIGETIAMTVQGELAASEVEGAVIIDSKTYENGNTEYTFELTKQTVTIKQASIAYILFTFDQITSVDLNNSPDLKSLYCYMNAIKGENMTNLVKSLPDRTGKTAGKIIVYASNDSREKNVITKADVAIAKAKNWKVLDWNNNEYEGI